MTSIEKIIIVVAVLTLVLCGLIAPFSSPQTQIFLDNLHWTTTSAAATALAWLGYRKADVSKKRFKKWFFFGLASYFIGQLLWDVQTYTHHNAFPAPSDIFYLAMGPLIIIGFVQALKTQLSISKISAFRIDTLSFTTAILGYVLVLYLPNSASTNSAELLVLTAYPVSILGAACVSLLVVPYLRPRFMLPWLLFSIGLSIEGAIWMQWNLNELKGLNETNTLLNKLFSFSDILLGIGAYGWHLNPSADSAYRWRCRRIQKIIPLVALSVGACTAILISIQNGPQPYAYYIAITSIVAILIFSAIRQSILLRESEKLFEAQKIIAEKEREYQQVVQYDPLTNLPNRWMMHTRLEQALVNASDDSASIGLLFIDINRFKTINDSFGHLVGDEFLVEIAKRLAHISQDLGTLGRMGSDKFLLIVESNTSETGIYGATQRIIDAINAPISLNQHEFIAEVCIGISLYPRDAKNAIELARNANTALHRAKLRGNSNYQFYSEEFTQQARSQLDLDVGLRKAIANQEFYLEYQPIFSIRNGMQRVRSLEALVRWKKSSGQIIPPNEFIPYAEDTGLIFPIGEWVIREACTTLSSINKALPEPIELSINISPKQFRERSLPEFIGQTLNAFGINPRLITLEITETAVFDHEDDAVEALFVLKSLGVLNCTQN